MISFISWFENQEDLHGSNSSRFLLLQTQMKIKAASNAEETIPSEMDKIVVDLIRVPPVARIMTDQCK